MKRKIVNAIKRALNDLDQRPEDVIFEDRGHKLTLTVIFKTEPKPEMIVINIEDRSV